MGRVRNLKRRPYENIEANSQRKELSRLPQTRGSSQPVKPSERIDINVKDLIIGIASAPQIQAIGNSRIIFKQGSDK
ncbi:hypothetical protein GcM1_247050 [Golovinomyces cichoracearum]|uniref:Uncharacterized protein n=1 Tax=Golovinomyces cichoracearum TaxID=62708 RepID=A0A420IDE8_9PEZI|nr:hypothetical protein GcM1_247050 [Golovinomyces cichoracearum]